MRTRGEPGLTRCKPGPGAGHQEGAAGDEAAEKRPSGVWVKPRGEMRLMALVGGAAASSG